MKEPDFLHDIKAVSDRIRITHEGAFKILDKEIPIVHQQAYLKWHQPLNNFGQNSGDENQTRSTLQTQLTNSLYSLFYCTGVAEKEGWEYNGIQTQGVSGSGREKNIQRLSDANQTENGIDRFWTVYSTDGGATWVHKNGEMRYLVPNEWELHDQAEINLKKGSVVNLKILKEDRTSQPAFYHVKSSELISQQAALTRFYFNITFEGAVVLVREITRLFNRYKVPFLFKCLNQPELYARADAAVLYLDKPDCRFGAGLLRRILPEIQPFLLPRVPLFTYALLPGMAFSEDPGNGQSYGMSRCSLIAEGIVNTFYKEVKTGEGQFSEILRVFKKNGIDPERIYLKPNSKFPYDFSVLTDQHNQIYVPNN